MKLRSISVLLLSVVAATQEPIVPDRYLVLSTSRTNTLRGELDTALAKGFRIVGGDPANNLLILQRGPEQRPRNYVINDRLLSTVKKNEYKGFRILPWSLSESSLEVGAVLESLRDGEPQPEYKVSSTVFTRNLQKDLDEASVGGFRAVAMTGSSGQIALLEKVSSDKPTSYLLLAAKKISTMEKEIAEAARKSFKVIAAIGAGKEILVLMEKQEPGENIREYRVISTTRTSTFEKEINEAAAAGYRILPKTGAALQKGSMLTGTYGYEQAIIMEKVETTSPVQYRFIGAKRESTIQRELNEAPASCEVNTAFLSYQEAVVLLACADRGTAMK